ncbi:MAG: hypothetical protein IJZ25_01820, partial [Lachnospiraceae bacterium]|nr:hypothetical protein [Lachnospiraceae bacterium]
MKRSKRTISIMMIVCMLLTMIYGTGVVQAADGDYVEADSYMSSHVLKVDGQEYASGTLLDPSKEFALELYFSYNWDDISNNGYSYSYKLPEHITIGDVASQAAPNILYNASQQEIGTYYYKDDVIYFTFNNNTGDQTAFFNLAANWEGLENIGSITIPWNDGDQVVEFDSAHVFVSKNQLPDVFTLTDDGQYLKKYTITLQPKADYTGIAVNDVKLQDNFYGPHMYFAEEPDPSNPTHDICIKTYVADELTETAWRDFSTVNVVISGDNKSFTLTDIDIPANGKVVVEYYIIIPPEEKIVLDATNAAVYHRNRVYAIQEVKNTSTGETQVLKSFSEVTSWNANSAAWLLKEHGTAETIVDENEVEWNSVPYTISVNRYRTYCLGGSVTKDTISRFVGGEVIYDLDTAPYIESSKGWGTATSGDEDNDVTTLNWVVLPYDQYVTLSQLTATMSGTQLGTLLTGSEYATFRPNLLKSINSYCGTNYTSLTSAVVGGCVFTFDPNENTESQAAQPNFIWFSPLDTDKTPTAYFLHYNVMAEESVGSLSNGAEMWYTEYGSGEVGGKNPWFNPKAMSVSKYNDGVYQGADGNYYVDWTIGITLPAGSGGFEQILLWDSLQRYKDVPVGENGELYEVVDWLAGVSDGDYSAAYYFDNCNGNAGSTEWRQYLRDFSDKIFTVSSTDKSVAVQTVVNRIHGAFFSKAWDYSYGSSVVNSSINLNCSPHGFKFGGIHYTGDAVAAGQFTMDHEFESYGTVEIGDTVSPATIVFYIGDLPGTETGYTINIEYTTQVNPALVAALSEILERDSLERVELTNVLYAHQGLPGGNGGYYLSPSDGEIARVDSSYWLSTDDVTPPVSKGVEYNNLNDYLDYTVELNSEKTLEVERTVYKIKDSLSLEGIKYVSNSFVVYDESGAVVYSKDSSKTAASKYSGLVTFSCTSSSTATNSFTMTFDNSTGAFEDTNGKFQNLTIVYSVDADAIPNKIVLENTVRLYGSLDNSETGEKVDTLLGTASTSCGPDSVLSKDVTNEPNTENNYKAQFAVIANLESKYADEYLKSLEAGDVFTLTDTFEQNLSLDIDSIGVYYFNETTEKYVKMTSGYVLKYDDTEKTLSAEITVRDGVSKYKLEYAASIVGEQNAHTSFVNTAKIEGSSVAEVRFEDKIFKISYGAGAITEERVITLVKYDEINLETRLQGAQFELYKLSDGSWVELTTPENDVPSLTTDVDGKVVISNSLSEVSQFVQDECWYKLVEVKSPAGYALDETPIYYYVTDKEGNEPSVIPDGVVDYKIIDSAEGLVMVANDGLAIKIYKEDKIDGTALTGAAFSVYSNSACTNLLASSEAVSGENGVYLIDHIPVSSATATLYLKETKAPTGYSLDTTVYKITFENSQVKSIVSVDGTKTLNFSVEANGIELDYTNDATTGKLTISKEVIAKSDAAAAKSFTFAVKFTNASGTTLTANYAYTKFNEDGTVAGTGTIKSGNTCTLTDGQSIMIKGLPAGAKYTVTETVNAEFDPYYNIKNYAGTYDFTESKQGNVATGTIVAGDMDTVEFENRQYEEITVSALKILDAGTLEEQGEFEFELYDPAGQLVDTAVVDNQFGTAKFETPLKFYNTGTYNYKIKEKVPTDKPDYITYSTETITAKIVVTLDSSGNLKAAVTYSGGTGTSNNAITNKYSATGAITFTADKLINGQSDSEFMTAGAFEFEIREGSTLVATGKNDASGNIVFSEIEYELNGTTDNTGRHTYTVSEKSKTVKGWTYDNDTYTVVVDVTDNYDGTLNVSVVSGATKSGNNYAITPKSGKDAAFENTYEASASLNFRADKVLNGRTLAANQFEFAIYEGTTLIDTAKNTANGTITFDAIEFYRSYDGTDEETYLGTHTYTIKEVIPSPKVGGYTYDGTTYTVKVTATDDGKGNITLAVTGATKSGSTSTYDVNVSAGKDAAFVNSYSAKGSITFVADKLVNNDADHEFMTAGAFEFEIREGSTVVATGKNDANGNVTFTAIKYERNSTTDDVKNHTYTVVEKSGTLKGWAYDDSEYTVVVKVTDNNNGTLTAVATSGATASGSNYKITPKSGKTAVFENEYEVSEELVLMADKILEGRTLAANQFEFAVYEGTT